MIVESEHLYSSLLFCYCWSRFHRSYDRFFHSVLYFTHFDSIRSSLHFWSPLTIFTSFLVSSTLLVSCPYYPRGQSSIGLRFTSLNLSPLRPKDFTLLSLTVVPGSMSVTFTISPPVTQFLQ